LTKLGTYASGTLMHTTIPTNSTNGQSTYA